MHLILQGHYQRNVLLPGKEPEGCWAPAARYGRRPLPGTWRFPSFLQLCKVTVFQRNGCSRTKRCAGFCSEEFVLCLQRTAKNRSQANSSLEGEKQRPPGCQVPGGNEGQRGWKGACAHRARTARVCSSLGELLLSPTACRGCSLPAGSARPGFTSPAFRPADLKEPNGEP